jgi:zinc transport system substrate-binding protein
VRKLVSLGLAVAITATLGACSDNAGTRGIRVAAAFYPLAWAAREVGAGDVTVEDLTPPGAEPHEIQLTANQRSTIQHAKVVFYLGGGFQPELEDAVRDAGGRVTDLLKGLPLRPSNEEGLDADPHVWLDPQLMHGIAGRIATILGVVDPDRRDEYQQRGAALQQKIAALDGSFRTTLATCTLKTLVTTHEAFGYLAARYRLIQLGLTGLTPEAEPSAAQIRRVRDLARQGKVAAVFVEATDEGRRIGRSVARDVGVPARDLLTLESDPTPKDYLSAMRENLNNTKAGLRCS